MGMRQRTPQSQVEAYMQQQIEQRVKALFNAFTYIGEACIKEARENGSYADRTGNLRSSIGYVILRNGIVMSQSDFSQIKGQSGDGSQGAAKGKAFIESIVSEYQRGFVLVVVAGMKYAAAVEAKNFNVLTSAELTAKQMIPNILTKLGF